MQHNCVKCSQEYQSVEQDAYLCDKCEGNKKKIAEQIDRQFAPRPKAETILERYDNAKKIKGGFPRASDVF